MSKKRNEPGGVSARPKPLEYIPKEKPKIPTSTSEWFLFKAQNVYKQLTLNWGRKLVVGAFPFIAYFSVTFFDYRRTRYNFQLQQADFFKRSVACIANSPEVKETYGTDIKLKRASFWTITSGFVPWIKERHVWLGFSGQHRDGWIRMGLRRTDFVLDKEAVKLISSDIEQGLKKDMQISMMEVKGQDESENSDDHVGSADEVTQNGASDQSGESSSTVIESVPTESIASDTNENVSPTIIEETPQEDPKTTSDQNEKSEESVQSNSGGRDHSLTAKERIDQQIAEKEVKDKLTQEQNDKYMAEMRRLYPTLPENFGQNDIEQAVAIKKDRLIDGQIFNNTWDLLSLSIHPATSKDGQVYVLWDPEQTYVDQADYWIDTAWLSIRKPESLRASVAVVNQAASQGS